MKTPSKNTQTDKDHRNLEFEAETKRNIPRDNFVAIGKEMAEDFNKTFQLNWTYRNEFAKTVITISSGMLALLAALSSGSLLRTVPRSLLIANVASLLLTILLNVGSLWIFIKVTLVSHYVMELESVFAERYDKMIKDHGKFQPSCLNDLFLIPFDKAWKSNIIAYKLLCTGTVLFLLSLALLCFVGFKAIPSDKPIDSSHRSLNSSPQSFGSHSGAKCLKSK